METSEMIHVLLVEDNDDDAYLIGEALGAQFHLTRINHGQQAYQHLTTTPTPPDVILLDYRLPEMNGIEIIQAVQAQGKTLAYIMLTVDLQVETAVEAMKAGALDFLPKATGYDGLPEMIRKVDRLQRDRVEKERMAAALRERERQLQELNASKDKFFAILAHDLKNPLIGFLSFAKLLEQVEDLEQAEFTKLTNAFRTSAENLFALLENLLTWAQLQQGMIEAIPSEVPIGAFAERNITLLAPNAAQKQITLTNLIQAEIPVAVDVMMIDTVVRNLLANAIKFTEAGGTVTISATHDEQTVTVMVADTGIGIPPEKLANLFRIDAKCQRTGTAGEKGTGLGLILCKEFVERNGGRIGVESEVGKGTTFTFTLPKKPMNR